MAIGLYILREVLMVFVNFCFFSLFFSLFALNGGPPVKICAEINFLCVGLGKRRYLFPRINYGLM